MSEFAPTGQFESRIMDQEIAHLGALCVEASLRGDLPGVAAEQQVATGIENPNSAGSGFFLGNEVITSGDSVYRQVGTEAIEDLAASGVVRNGVTANGEQRRWGHKVFWHRGSDGKGLNTGGRMLIQADMEAADKGWVTADKVTGIYTKDSDGKVKNIIPERKDVA